MLGSQKSVKTKFLMNARPSGSDIVPDFTSSSSTSKSIRASNHWALEVLDADDSVEPFVAGFVDFAHPSRANLGQDLVGAEHGSGGKGHGFHRK